MFDAYHKWLGIPPADQPPNHYRLLAITLFEDDPTVIEMAADQRMRHLRTFQTSQESALAEKLLNEVTVARICLLRPERRAKYDAVLRAAQTASAPPAPPAPFAAPAPRPGFEQPMPPSAFAPASPPDFMMEEPSFAESEPPAFFQEPIPQPSFTEPVPQSEAPAANEHASYLEADPPTAYAVPYSRPVRRVRSKLPMFAIFGPLAGIAAVAAAIFVFNANNDSTESNAPPKRVHEQLAKSQSQVPPPASHSIAIKPRNFPMPSDTNLPSQFHPAEAILSWMSNSARAELPRFDDLASTGEHWWSSIPKPNLSRWMPDEVSVPPLKLTFDQDETRVEVPIGNVSASARLQILAWMDSIGPARQLVLQEKPELIAVTFEVDHEKSGYAVVRVKPWLGNNTSGVPCSLKRLHAMADTLPGQLQNAKASFQALSSQIDAAENGLQSLIAQSHPDTLGQVAQQVAIRDARSRIQVLHARQNSLARSGDRWTAQLQELPGLISAVEKYVGKTVQFQIYYTLDQHEIVVASTDDRPASSSKSASSASASVKP